MAKYKINNANDRRKDRMGVLTETGPDIAYIKKDGDAFNVTEHYHSARRKPYKKFTVASPEEYVHSSGVVIIDDMED